VPLWLIVADGKVMLAAFGISQWEEAVLPTLRRLVQ
jgi:hypothetical protein